MVYCMVLLAGREAITVCSSQPHKLAYPLHSSPHPIPSYHPPSALSPLKQVAIEAMDKKTFDLSSTVQMDPPDLKRLQLLLQGSISTQARAPSCRIFVGEGILYEMDQIVSVRLQTCCQTPISCSPLAVGKRKGGPGAQSHMSTMIYVTWQLLFHSCRSTKEYRSTLSSSVSHSQLHSQRNTLSV